MYVNSSDYEGISNAMLEAMAIGMPVVCTDCPIGGASATIRDGENGLLVPVGDTEALCDAMKRIIEDAVLSASLSENAAGIRDELSIERICVKWMDLI
jgi:glycosyltransferase involved in cell wall biosynthesis